MSPRDAERDARSRFARGCQTQTTGEIQRPSGSNGTGTYAKPTVELGTAFGIAAAGRNLAGPERSLSHRRPSASASHCSRGAFPARTDGAFPGPRPSRARPGDCARCPRWLVMNELSNLVIPSFDQALTISGSDLPTSSSSDVLTSTLEPSHDPSKQSLLDGALPGRSAGAHRSRSTRRQASRSPSAGRRLSHSSHLVVRSPTRSRNLIALNGGWSSTRPISSPSRQTLLNGYGTNLACSARSIRSQHERQVVCEHDDLAVHRPPRLSRSAM